MCSSINSHYPQRSKVSFLCLSISVCIYKSFFNSIFIHRYKDSHFEVRAKCTEAVGKLIMEYSSKFLDNMYLKYVGWALYDKSSKVRIAALDAVDKFYNSSLVHNIEAFTLRFR